VAVQVLARGLALHETGRAREEPQRVHAHRDLLVGDGPPDSDFLGPTLDHGRRLGLATFLLMLVLVPGIGMNITAAPEGAASLADVGVSRDDVLDSLMSRLAERYRAWRGNPSAPELATAYRARCDTIGREIQAHLPGGETLTGRAIEIDDAGRLVIETEGRTRAIGAGEVVHVRPVSGA
jgi:hypothetical protein